MKKLFDETFSGTGKNYRTLWYGYFNEVNSELANKIVETIKKDLQEKADEVIESTSWIFYNEVQSGDAIEDKVRASFMVKELHGSFQANYNMSDYDFVTAFDSLEKFKTSVLEALK